MTEDRGAGVLRIAALDAELIGQHRIAAGSIDEKSGLPLVFAAGFHARCHRRAGVIEFDACHPAALERGGAFTLGIAKQDLVELRTPYLVRVGMRFVDGIGKIKRRRPRMPGRDKLRAVLGHANDFDFRGHTEPFEQRQIERQQRLTDMKTRMAGFFDQDDIASALRQ